jgi:nucleotide-binding universal stress UspA family protein
MATVQVTPVGVGIQKVLIATDFSNASKTAVDFGLRFAEGLHARASVVSVVVRDQFLLAGPEVFVAAKDAAERDMHALQDELLSKHLLLNDKDHMYLLEGDPAAAILEFARATQADLIVVGTHGRSGLPKALLGSVAERIFRSSSVPVLTLGPQVEEGLIYTAPRKILVAADFTPASRQAVRYGATLAAKYACGLTLLHVVGAHALDNVPDRPAVVHGLERRITELMGRESAHVPTTVRIEASDVTRSIVDVAREISADLLLMGVRASAGLLDRLRIPHAYQVIRECSCPVLTLRETKPDFELN